MGSDSMHRRRFLSEFLLPTLMSPLITQAACKANAPQGSSGGRKRRIGYMLVGPPPSGPAPNIDALRDGLRDLGYTEGTNVEIEFRWLTPGAEDHLQIARDLVSLPVDVIVASAVPAVRAAKLATTTIPIVMVNVGDPVAVGLVASLARPGGNVTGVSTLAPPLSGKRLELFKELKPDLRAVGVLGNTVEADKTLDWHEAEMAAGQLTIRLVRLQVALSTDLEPAFALAAREESDGLLVLNDDLTFQYRDDICRLAIAHGLPTVSAHRLFAQAGALFSYGPSTVELHRRAAFYVDRLLEGTSPQDLPVERPSRFELVVNRRTAEAIGLPLPSTFLARANDVL